ncbi:hypothetical protein VQL36_11540 [Chengkuizengella sp. SCS-71B]|uniref:hypothetical protein n=1 Tax=Chengkuizengella sp. SCS-71B TaxID=3115290 RepID=UPI0032C23651
MIISIANEQVKIQYESIEIDEAIGQRSTASFTVLDLKGQYYFSKGQRVEIKQDNNSLVFGGVIDRSVETYISLAGEGKIHKITCTDWTFLSDKRIIARAYENKSAGEIVQDIVDHFLSHEEVNVGNVQAGPNVIEAVFNYIPITDAMDALAEKAGFEWWIDKHRQLHFVDPSTYPSNIYINEHSPIRNIEVEPAGEKYRNKQYIKAGRDITDPQTESFKGNGSQQSFTVGYPIALEPMIKVNNVVQTVGLNSSDEDKSWYWSKESNTITQEKSATPLGEQDTLEITYQGSFDIIAVTYDSDEVIQRSSLEGGTGIHEFVDDDPDVNSREAAFQSANAKLAKYGKIGKRIKFETELSGLHAGELLRIELPTFNINDDYLIESIAASERNERFTYTVTAVAGAVTGGWVTFFKEMANKGKAFVLRENISENEVLILLEQLTESIGIQDEMTYSTFACPIPNVTNYPSHEIYPC